MAEPHLTDPGDDGPGASRRGRPRWLLGGLVGLLVAGFIALLFVGLTADRTNTALDSALRAGRPFPAPDFSLPLLANAEAIGRRNGTTLGVDALRGHAVVLNFWASWCVPCRSEAPLLEGTWKAHRGQGLIVLGVNVQDLTQDALAFIRSYGHTFPTVRDRGHGISRVYGLTGIPETFFIDATGDVRAHKIGEISEADLENGVAILEDVAMGPQPAPGR